MNMVIFVNVFFLHMLNNNKVGAYLDGRGSHFFPRLAWILGPFYHKNLTKYC